LIPDQQGVEFLQWCLPRLHLRWRGFRKVRRQVYKRIARRMTELALSDIEGYRKYLQSHPEEWQKLDALCWISISRFYRDRRVFEQLGDQCLPVLAKSILGQGKRNLHCWSAGCAAGEEAYTLALLFHHRLAPRFPMLRLHIIATDADPTALRRAERGCYPNSSLRELPAEWRADAFVEVADDLCLKAEYRRSATFLLQDIRECAPAGIFHIILCRNLAFTYFDDALQRSAMERLTRRLAPGGILVVGKVEIIPEGPWGLEPWAPQLGIFRKTHREKGKNGY